MAQSVSTPTGEWVDIDMVGHLKGFCRNPKYYPAIGEACLMSGPNCDDASGDTWSQVQVLWRDDLFAVTRTEGCWPTVTKLDLALFQPLPDLVAEALREAFGAAAPEFVAALHAALEKRGLEVVPIAKATVS